MRDSSNKNTANHLAKKAEKDLISGRKRKKFLNRFTKNKTQFVEQNQHLANEDKHTNTLQQRSHNDGEHVAEMTAANYSEYSINPWYAVNGRIGRVQLLAYSMIWGIIASIFVIAAIVTGLEPFALIDGVQAESISITSLILLTLTIPAWVYSVILLPRRRLHDVGKSGWWLLLYIIPIINLYLMYLMYLKRGDMGANQYGLPAAPYTTIELILAIISPIFSLFIFYYSSQLQVTNYEQDDMQFEVIDADTVPQVATQQDTAQAENNDTLQAQSDENVLNELDPETVAQAQTALDNTINASTLQVEYDEFLRESQAKIFVDDSTVSDVASETIDNSIGDSDVDAVYIEGQVDQPAEGVIQTDTTN